MSNIVLNAKYLTKNYYVGNSVLKVLRGISFDLIEGQIVAVVGESGAGKSTLLHIIGMLDRPTTGHLIFNGENLSGKSDAYLANFRNLGKKR